MSVVLSLEDVGPCRKQLKVEVPAPAVEAETQRVVREYGQKVRLPGFRKGKVPSELVRRRFASEIEQEVKERLLPRYWRQAQAESSIEPLLPPEVDEVADLQPGEPLTFIATVETRPRIELRDTASFDLPDPSVDPGTLEIDDTIDNLRKQVAEWVTVERPAARGDLVAIEITALGSPEHPEERTDNVQVEVGDPQVWEELSVALQGLAAGQETTFTHRHEHPPAGAEEGAEPVVHEQSYRVKALEVKERDLPPLDDAFAAKVNPELQTFDALREAVVNRIKANKEEQRREARHRALLDQLRDRHPIDLPQGVVRREVEQLVQEYAENLARRGVDVEKAGIDWNAMANEMLPLAEKRVHARLLLDAIADDRNLAVTEEEFERTLAMLARAQGVSTPVLRRKLDEDGRLTTLRSQLRREKTIRTLLGEPEEEAAPAVLPGTNAEMTEG
ncbi:MAG TPA: trigger factor [Thermoanaerobaculia bacterium]|jgi:trigger factor|nr:trigger factor [Thermoanaerobaculia bacterium]